MIAITTIHGIGHGVIEISRNKGQMRSYCGHRWQYLMTVDSNLSASFRWRSLLASGMVWMTLKNVKTSIISLDRFPSIDNVPEIALSAAILSPSSYFCWILSRNNRNLSPYGHPFVDITVNAISEKRFKQGSCLKWMVLGQSRRSEGIELDGPNDWKWIVIFETGQFSTNRPLSRDLEDRPFLSLLTVVEQKVLVKNHYLYFLY